MQIVLQGTQIDERFTSKFPNCGDWDSPLSYEG